MSRDRLNVMTERPILGRVSDEMSLPYGRLFDTTICTEYERALDLAKSRIGTLPAPPCQPATDTQDWHTTPTVKTALASCHCLRAAAQGPCPYANICKHCPSLHVAHVDLPVLSRQRDDAATLADDATSRGRDAETERHLRWDAPSRNSTPPTNTPRTSPPPTPTPARIPGPRFVPIRGQIT